jgi:predicted amidohydrolase YtcJ
VVGRGYNEAEMKEGRSPTRRDLDAALPDRPVYITRTCGHIGVANSRAFAIAGVDASTPAPAGGAIVRGEHGELAGPLHETAMGLVADRIPTPSADEYEAMIAAAARHQLALGITSVTDAGVTPDILAVYRSMDTRGRLPWRVNTMALRRPLGGTRTLPLPEPHVSDHLRVDSIKLLADGGLSGATAALSMPYRDREDRGLLRLEAAEIHELTREAHERGLRIGVHAIGDAAIAVVLDVFERLASARPGARHRIEHFGLPDREQMTRAARLGLVAVPQTIFVECLGTNFRRHLPETLLARAYPVRGMLDAGIDVALSSDAPVVADDDPLAGIRAAVRRRDTQGYEIAGDQAITAEEALRAYTMGGALASGDEANRGSLEVGKWADLAVLDGNPLSVEPEALTEIGVEMTMVGGEVVYER